MNDVMQDAVLWYCDNCEEEYSQTEGADECVVDRSRAHEFAADRRRKGKTSQLYT